MHVIIARNVEEAYNNGLWWLKITGVPADSRNGGVIRAPTPVTTVYTRPWERVLFDDKRDANPYFHVMEAMWMLAGGRDVAFPSRFAKQIAQYSDDGINLHGAYGFRWRRHFEVDQLDWVIDLLKREPNTRRAVLEMWDAVVDIDAVDHNGQDVPCNTHAYFCFRDGKLDMMVTCRSNDVVWGCYGANAVHFSYLMEYVAQSIGVEMGRYYHVSYDYHIYERHWPLMQFVSTGPTHLGYPGGRYQHQTLLYPSDKELFDEELQEFLRMEDTVDYEHPFIQTVLSPMISSHKSYKRGDLSTAKSKVHSIADYIWSDACLMWLDRRKA